MKKSLLTLGAVVLTYISLFAQNTNASVSQNDATSTKQGYAFNYSKGSDGSGVPATYNCIDSQGADGATNIGNVTAYSFSYNVDSAYAELTFTGKQSNGVGSKKNVGDGYLWNRLTTGNCELSRIDLSSSTTKIKANVKSSVAIPEFYIGVVVDQNGKAVLGDELLGASTDNTVALEANKWTEVEFSVATKGWYNGGNNLIDLDKVEGLFFTVRDKDATDDSETPTGIMAIDWVTVGDGVPVALTKAEINNLEFRVFPNPVIDILNVTYNIPSDESAVIVLSNFLGQQVISVEGNESSVSIDVSELNSGIYFASIIVDGIIVSTKRVVID
jgi:hypothetical protein